MTLGPQVGLLLLDMLSVGADPDSIHVVGFSLGAHVAGCAGQVVKNRGRMIGRISGKRSQPGFESPQGDNKKLYFKLFQSKKKLRNLTKIIFFKKMH